MWTPNTVALTIMAVLLFLLSLWGFRDAYHLFQQRDERGNVKVVRRSARTPPQVVEVPAHSEFACPTVTLLGAILLGYLAWRAYHEDEGEWY